MYSTVNLALCVLVTFYNFILSSDVAINIWFVAELFETLVSFLPFFLWALVLPKLQRYSSKCKVGRTPGAKRLGHACPTAQTTWSSCVLVLFHWRQRFLCIWFRSCTLCACVAGVNKLRRGCVLLAGIRDLSHYSTLLDFAVREPVPQSLYVERIIQ